MEKPRIRNLLYACVILHNMILKDEGRAICEDYEEENQSNTLEISDKEKEANSNEMYDNITHHNFQTNLVEHI
ncbi:hypothetical protein Hanom_Chr02g00105461 [Helianthus anomalus]